jgi:hypothetical protein
LARGPSGTGVLESTSASFPLAAAAALVDDRRASLVSFVNAGGGLELSEEALRFAAGSEDALSCDPRGVGSEFLVVGLLSLLVLAKSFNMVSAVGGLI